MNCGRKYAASADCCPFKVLFFFRFLRYNGCAWQRLCLCNARVVPYLKYYARLPRVACPPFGIMLWQRRGNYTPYIVIARLRKAEYLESLRQISSLVIARLGKAEAIQYKLLNPYTNIFSRKDYQTGLLRSARNDAGGGETGFSGQAQK